MKILLLSAPVSVSPVLVLYRLGFMTPSYKAVWPRVLGAEAKLRAIFTWPTENGFRSR